MSNGSIGYHPLGRSPKISHLAFADDVMLFFEGRSESLHGINDTLDSFQNISGLSTNKATSAMFHAGLSQEETAAISACGFTTDSLPIRYLGLPFLH